MLVDPTTCATKRVGVIGARGYAGAELIRLIAAHPALEVEYASSRRLAGEQVTEYAPNAPAGMIYSHLTPDEVSQRETDVVMLALPDGASDAYLDAIEESGNEDLIVVDLSADRRFRDDWVYGLPEHNAKQLAGAKRISNPGCYATAMQLALRPIMDDIASEAHCFGVSGFSGAGTNPSPRNDPALLRGGMLPYRLTGHTHEREVSRHLGQPVRFAPHVAPFARGITLTALVTLREPVSVEDLAQRYREFYRGHPLIYVLGEPAPMVQETVGRNGAFLGGMTVDVADRRRVAVVCALDNLLKGASSQAVQNINTALGFGQCTGLDI